MAERHINPPADWITSKRTTIILAIFLVCFEYWLSLSVQIMSLRRIIDFQMKGDFIFSICREYLLHLLSSPLGTTGADFM